MLRMKLDRFVFMAGLAAAALMLLGGVAGAAEPPTSAAPVADKIMCLCGCNSVLSSCPHPECGWGVPEKESISRELAAGKTAEELIDYYVATFGEEVLAAPAKSGFNLTAWLMPFAFIMTAAVVLFYLVRMWSGRNDEPEPVPVQREELDDEIRRRLDDELNKFD